MAPCLVIETSGFMVFAEWVVLENPFLDEKKPKRETTLHITIKNKGVLKRLKDTLSTSSTKEKDKNVTKARGHYYATVPNPVEFEDEKTDQRLLCLRFVRLNVHMVTRYPDKLVLISPYMKLEVTEPSPSLTICSMTGRRLV